MFFSSNQSVFSGSTLVFLFGGVRGWMISSLGGYIHKFKMKPKNDDYPKENILFLGCHFQVPFCLEGGEKNKCVPFCIFLGGRICFLVFSMFWEQMKSVMGWRVHEVIVTIVSKLVYNLFTGQNQPSWLVVSTHLKNISQNGNLPQIGVKIKNIWNHQPASYIGVAIDLLSSMVAWTSQYFLPFFSPRRKQNIILYDSGVTSRATNRPVDGHQRPRLWPLNSHG